MNLDSLYPRVKYLAEKLIEECKKQGYNILITSTYRSKQEQDELFAQGRTKPGKIITNAKGENSLHNYKVAFDFCINDKQECYNPVLLEKVGQIGKTLGLEWGGDFKTFKDMPHFQYTKGLTLSDFQSGKVPDDVMAIPKEIEKFKYKDDSEISDWAKKAVYELKEKGIMLGDGENFRPKDSITREEIAVLVAKILKRA